MQIELTLEIARPPDVVFGLLTDEARLGEWVAGLAEHRVLERAEGHVGSRFAQSLRTGEGLLEFEGHVTEWLAPRTFAYRLDNPQVALDVRFDLAAEGAGTRLVHSSRAELRSWLLRAVKMRLERSARERLEADLARLRGLLE